MDQSQPSSHLFFATDDQRDKILVGRKRNVAHQRGVFPGLLILQNVDVVGVKQNHVLLAPVQLRESSGLLRESAS